MATVALPRRPKGPSPRLDTLHRVELILRRAHARDEGPLRLAEIKRRMGVKSIRHATVRACVDELVRFRFVTFHPAHGALWTLREDPSFWGKSGFVKLA
jgi:hypothetical protein